MIQIYKKISWILENRGHSLQDILGKEKCRLLKKGFQLLDEEGFSYGVEKLTMETLQYFYYNLYIPFIQNKQNANTFPLIDRLGARVNDGEDIYFGYIKDNKKVLIGGGIFFQKIQVERKGLSLGYRAYDESKTITKLKLGYYIEYLFYDFGIKNHFDFFSRGKDRNGYGLLGSNIGTPLHKLELHHTPCFTKGSNLINIEESKITQESLFFTDLQDNGELSTAIVFSNKAQEEINRIYGIIQKRGLTLQIFPY